MKHPINGCDYINASWISANDASRTWKTPTPTMFLQNLTPTNVSFIAAQGPMLHTTEHFLQMLNDYNVDMVIMLTKLVESNNQCK